MAKLSAGLLLFRRNSGGLEVLLIHPGGPFWMKKDEGAWSIPKGEYEANEEPLAAARRELEEETGLVVDGDFLALGTVKQSGGKLVTAWALERDADTVSMKSNMFEMEWPPKSGRMASFPEVDRFEWFGMEAAREKILNAQAAFLERLVERV
jgi:predicted NUDIX family NTP pyrophosphohydrolase